MTKGHANFLSFDTIDGGRVSVEYRPETGDFVLTVSEPGNEIPVIISNMNSYLLAGFMTAHLDGDDD